MKFAITALTLLLAVPAYADVISFSGFANSTTSGFSQGSSYKNERALTFGQQQAIGLSTVTFYSWHASSTTFDTTKALSDSFFVQGADNFVADEGTAFATGTFAYLDKFSNGPGGLGVAERVNSKLQVKPDDDDNVSALGSNTALSPDGAPEVVGFSISSLTGLTSFTFNDKDHKSASNSSNDWTANDELYWTWDGGLTWKAEKIESFSGTDLSTLSYASDIVVNKDSIIAFAYKDKQFYVDATTYTVPEPGMLTAFAGGLCCMGFGFGRRRRNVA